MTDLLKPDVPAELRTAVPAQDRFAAALRAFGPLGILAILVIVFSPTAIVGATLVLLWVSLSRTPWHELGFVRPKSWIGPVTIGLAGGVAFKLVMKAVVMPLLGAEPINQAYHYLAGNPAALLKMTAFVIIGGGFAEETVYRGFLFERLGKLLGSSAAARTSTVLLTAAWFALLHYLDQGLAGVEQAAITGLVFGAIFAVTRRIWMLMIAHAAFDLVALAIIYWNLELKVAHLIFK
jgi:membrane protease YdiL (CAAX protease family)